MLPQLETTKIDLSNNDQICTIIFNRPEKKNSMNKQGYKDWFSALNFAKSYEKVKVVILTGAGSYFSAGTDLSPPSNGENPFDREVLERDTKVTRGIIELMIDFPKILIGAVNGPAFGISVTTLTLCDFIYTVPEAVFSTPFMKLALCAEVGKPLTAREFKELGFVNDIFDKKDLLNNVLKISSKICELPTTAVMETKKLIRDGMKGHLKDANDRELRVLVDRFLHEEFQEAMFKFFSSKKTTSKL
ncbi:Enoyl-CoA delta isomerase 2, mitochondrial [Clydaea vesicula]|uniref:Enoyl-CoA delta isomerase 2, mitochondrial n=1 Tax=Clydaea vesicula TaxID=447962 RepID=A0AAD5U6W1_9FUNG|nr:Enoyl-CoA delta isomerase 2, mitochondrial [Clydaea vesicula]